MGTSGKSRILTLIVAAVVIVAAALIVRISMLTFNRPAASSVEGKSYQLPDVAGRVERGSLFDRNGILLAAEIPSYTCAVMLQSLDSRELTAERLAPILFMTASDILAAMEGKTTYAAVKHNLNGEEADAVRQAVSRGQLPGVLLEKRYTRFYPQKHHAAQLIGFTGIDLWGLEGLEYTFNETLTPLARSGESVTRGSDIYLTLDMRVQFFTDQAVEKVVQEHNPDAVSIIVMHADTGEILAWSSYPWYDLNGYSRSSAAERLNRPASAVYEPGSVFKIFSLAVVLEIEPEAVEELFICDGSYEFSIPGARSPMVIGCVKPHGEVGPREMLKFSCNGAVAHYALQTDPRQFYDGLLAFGFGFRTGPSIPGESAGILADPATWSGRTLPTIAFGQEIGTTALQMAAAATVFSNDGMLLQPKIIHRIVSADGDAFNPPERTEVRQVVGKQTAAEILDFMVAATEPGGTAVHAAVPDIPAAAKTGTSQILDPAAGTYSENHVLASCIAIFPAGDPELIIYAAVDKPKGGQFFGANVAAPAIRRITEDLLAAGLTAGSRSHIIVLSGEGWIGRDAQNQQP